ncbi:MAG: FAD-dependent oxidoreductase [Parvibaculaceae bacterium]
MQDIPVARHALDGLGARPLELRDMGEGGLAQGPLDGPSYYRATANPFSSGPPLEGVVDADVAIVGAGFTGLSAALELRRLGFSVVVLDRGPVGWGATGRNGGQICTGYSPGMEKLEKALGSETARHCFQMAEEAKQLLKDRVAAHAIQCDLKWGYLVCAPKAGHMRGLAEHQEELRRYGYGETELLDRSALEERVATRIYQGALSDRGAGHFHPLNYALGLARAVKDDGGRICERSAVTRIEEGARPVVRTEQGEVRARFVILGCNAYLDGLVARIQHRVMPVASYVVATEPLGEERALGLIARDEAVTDANFVVDYYRLTGDRRLLFGGRCSYSGFHPKDLAASMRPRMLKIFPQLADVGIDYAWGGMIGITHNRLPDCGRLGKNIYYTQGYSGQGVVLSGLFGKLMAEAVAGDASRFDVFTRIRHAPFPGGPLRRPALAAGMLYYRLRDLLA